MAALPTVHVDYTGYPADPARGLEVCPTCGRVGSVLRVPIRDGEQAGRVPVRWVHAEDLTELVGVCRRSENVVACWGWEDPPPAPPGVP